MTPLRQRFLHDLQLRNYSPRTLETYLSHVVRFARHFGRSPDQLGAEDVRLYQIHLLEQRHASWSVFNQAVCALRFLYGVTLRAPFPIDLIPYGKKPKTLPAVLSREEVAQLFAEIAERAPACRFADCRHFTEPGCAVRAAVEAGEVAASRYASYRDIVQEGGAVPEYLRRP